MMFPLHQLQEMLIFFTTSMILPWFEQNSFYFNYFSFIHNLLNSLFDVPLWMSLISGKKAAHFLYFLFLNASLQKTSVLCCLCSWQNGKSSLSLRKQVSLLQPPRPSSRCSIRWPGRMHTFLYFLINCWASLVPPFPFSLACTWTPILRRWQADTLARRRIELY